MLWVLIIALLVFSSFLIGDVTILIQNIPAQIDFIRSDKRLSDVQTTAVLATVKQMVFIILRLYIDRSMFFAACLVRVPIAPKSKSPEK